ncbi:hypothetical protein [Streptomyces hypolithicus]
MSTARHLSLIDLLRARRFPAERRRSDASFSGPGYHTVELGPAAATEDQDAARRLDLRGQCVAEHDALLAVLGAQWGEPQVFDLWSVLERRLRGEEIPAPWDELSAAFECLHLWRADGRWIAVALALEEDGPSYELLAVVTEVDPP